MGIINSLKSFFLANNKAAPDSDHTSAHQPDIDSSKTANIATWIEKNQDLFFHLEDKYYQYFIGVNSLLDLELNEFEINVIEVLEKIIKSEQSLAEEMPRLPGIVPKLLHLLRTDDFDWQRVADLIESDPVVLVGFIKLANSPLYNLQIKDEKLDVILSQLGLLEIREVIMKVALKPIMMSEGGHFLKHSGVKIWDHSLNSATACRILAQKYNQEPFNAYLAGLLCNIGMAIVVKKLNDIKEFSTVPRSVKFQKRLLTLSKQLSVKIAQNWEINTDVIDALKEQLFANTEKIDSPLGTILYEGTAVSMKYILVGEQRWQLNEQTIEDMEETAFDFAYQQLQVCTE